MKTDEQIKQNAEEYCDENFSPLDVDRRQYAEEDFIAGAHSRDEEITRLSAEIEDDNYVISKLRKELFKLRNPWISVEERLPEIEDEKEERTGEVFVCIKDGVYLVAHYSYFYKAWYAFDDRGGCMYRKIRTPRYWMPIPELKEE